MAIPIQEVQKGAVAAVDRTVYVDLVLGSDYVTPKTGTLTGTVKATLSRDGGTNEASDAAYTQLDATNHPGVHKLVLSADEVSANRDILVTIATGGGFGQALVRVTSADPQTEGAMSSRAMRHQAGRPT